MAARRPPARWKNVADYSADDHLRSMRGERIESEEYVAYRRGVLEGAGLEDELGEDEDETPLAEMTPEQHYARLRGRRL